MDDQRAQRALGGILLALVLIPALLPGADPAPPPLDRPSDPVVAAALGWPLDPAEPDPAVWSTLPGIGPSRAALLADAAARGGISCPDEVLRLPGFGIKMAAVVSSRVSWSTSKPSSSACSVRVKGP